MNVPFEMDRRALLGRILLLAGAATLPAGCIDLGKDSGGSNFKFDTAQTAGLSAIADTLIPKGTTFGALDVGVPKQFEGLMRDWASQETRDMMVATLASIEKAAKDAKGKDFAGLTPAERVEVLTPIDAAALKPAAPKPGEKKLPLFTGPTYSEPGYAKLRQLIIYLFYYSEPAQTKIFDYVHNPGRWDPSIPVTPETRQSGGLGMI